MDPMYKELKKLEGIENMESIQVKVVGSMFDDLNN